MLGEHPPGHGDHHERHPCQYPQTERLTGGDITFAVQQRGSADRLRHVAHRNGHQQRQTATGSEGDTQRRVLRNTVEHRPEHEGPADGRTAAAPPLEESVGHHVDGGTEEQCDAGGESTGLQESGFEQLVGNRGDHGARTEGHQRGEQWFGQCVTQTYSGTDHQWNGRTEPIQQCGSHRVNTMCCRVIASFPRGHWKLFYNFPLK